MIGIFDSGVGGLGIYKEIRRLLPKEPVLYLADSKNCPYGEKSDLEIKQISLDNTKFLIGEGCNIIVIACNTASTIALEYVRCATSTPEVAEAVSTIGVVPVVKTASMVSKNKRIGILATKKTVESKYLHNLVEQFCPEEKGYKIYYQAANELVKLVEGSTCCHSEPIRLRSGQAGVEESLLKRDFSTPSSILRAGYFHSSRNDNIKIIRKYLQPFIKTKVDVVALGCTHFPFLRKEIREIMESKVAVLDSNGAVARQVARITYGISYMANSKMQIANHKEKNNKRYAISNKPIYQFYTSGNPEKVKPVVVKLLGEKIDRVIKKR